MPIIAKGTETYFLLTGIRTDSAVKLGPHTELLPATCHLTFDGFAEMMKESVYDFAIGLLLIPEIRSQLHVTADNQKELAHRAWNAQWDCLLLSALFDRTVLWNLQSDIPAEQISPGTALNVSNYHLSGFKASNERQLSTADKDWLEKHFEIARRLVKNPSFETAVHSLASFRWHPHPRTQLALIWSGIESLFRIDSEIVFRVSLYTARFLAPDDQVERLKVFSKVKQLYKQRSAAVHGSKMKGDSQLAVQESAELLGRLIRRCAEMNRLPDIDSLAP
jgi:hypothetical protein